MKKKSIYFIALFLISFVFLMPSNVFAAKKKIGTCDYSPNTTTLFKGEIKKLTVSVDVYDNKTIKGTIKGDGKTVTFTNSKSTGALSGKNVGAIYVKQPKNFYKSYEKYGESCPSLQFTYEMNSLGIYTDGGKVSESATSVMVDGVKKGGNSSSSSANGNKTYCTLGPQKVWNNNKEITATFFLKGKEKWVRLTSSSNNSNEFKYDAATTLDDIAFSVNSNSVKTFWSTSCKAGSTPMYFKTTVGNRSQIIIQTKKPKDSENGAYVPSEAKYDDGGVKKNPLDGLNQKYDSCSQLIDTQTEGSFGWLLQKLLNYIKIAGPILVVLLSALDFIKAVASSEEDAFKKAQSRLVIRLVAALALFLVPTFVELLLGLINGIEDPTCGLK